MMKRLFITAVAVVALVIAFSVGVTGQRAEGFILRGTLTDAASDGTPYFNIGEAVVIALPANSALAPGLKNLVGKKVVISVVPD